MKIINDIVREMRDISERCDLDNGYDINDAAEDVRAIAGKLEKVVAENATTTPTCEKSSQVGNTAKMREALEAVVKVGYPYNFHHEAPHISGYCYEITTAINKCFAALAEPPRNCDVGTAEEQAERYRKFCSAHKYLGSDFSYMCKGFGKGRCPFFNSNTKSKCEFAWAQMPYESEVK